MRHSMLSLFLAAAAFVIAGSAAANFIDFVEVGDPGNPTDTLTNCTQADCGSVATSYFIGKFEVTNQQYARFLNAVADTDPNALYNTEMTTDARGGIVRSGSPGSYTYAAKNGRWYNPVVFVSFYDTLRFANWLHNGQPTAAQDLATTEDGAYTITQGGVATNTIVRNGGAEYFLPTENEWYKAAFYDTGLGSYYDYATSTNTKPVSGPPPGGRTRPTTGRGPSRSPGRAASTTGSTTCPTSAPTHRPSAPTARSIRRGTSGSGTRRSPIRPRTASGAAATGTTRTATSTPALGSLATQGRQARTTKPVSESPRSPSPAPICSRLRPHCCWRRGAGGVAAPSESGGVAVATTS